MFGFCEFRFVFLVRLVESYASKDSLIFSLRFVSSSSCFNRLSRITYLLFENSLIFLLAACAYPQALQYRFTSYCLFPVIYSV